MSIDAEAIADRRRLRRKLSFWRVVGVLALIVAVVDGRRASPTRRSGVPIGQPHVARVSIDGFIAGNQRMADLLKRVGECRSVSGVVISINSPGGTTTGAEELYRNIRRLADQEAARRLRRRHGGLGRLHHGDRRRPHRRARDVARRLDRRDPAVSALLRAARARSASRSRKSSRARSRPSRAASSRPRRKRAPPCSRSSTTPTIGSSSSSPTRRHYAPERARARCRTAACSTAGRPWA